MQGGGKSGKGARGDAQNRPTEGRPNGGEEKEASGGVESTEDKDMEPTMSYLVSILWCQVEQQEAR